MRRELVLALIERIRLEHPDLEIVMIEPAPPRLPDLAALQARVLDEERRAQPKSPHWDRRAAWNKPWR